MSARVCRTVLFSIAISVLAPCFLFAQGTIRGTVTDAGGSPAPGAAVHINGTLLGGIVDSTGTYRITRVPAGSYVVRVTKMGFAPDSASIVVGNGESVVHDTRLHPAAELLGNIVVTAQRLGESEASALERRAEAPNVVNVMAGDVIRALPNANAAEAAGRMPGVTTERDEGEGKFVQVRGTEPRLTNVTIDGAHVPGTERGSRVPKLDDIPSDVLGAIEVSKTLTADMDADAIGGSVNLVTKMPEGEPHGYLAGQYGAITLLNKNQYQGGFAYGGRFGSDKRLGLLLGGSADRNNRTSNDLEPAWTVDASGRAVPIEWSQRDYEYRRNRFGLGGDVDYRFPGGSTLALRGLYSLFQDYGTTYNNDIVMGATGSTFGAFGDSAGVGTRGFGTGAEVTRMAFRRSPVEQLYGGNLGGRTMLGPVEAKITLNASGTTSHLRDYRFQPFVYDGPGGQGLTFAYDASNPTIPTFSYATPAMAAAAADPANFELSHYFTIDRATTGRDLGAALDFSDLWRQSDRGWGSTLNFGAKVIDERKRHTSSGGFWFTGSPVALPPMLSGFSDPNYYSDIVRGFSIGPMPDEALARAYENANPFTNGTDTVRNILGSYNGSERILAGYISNRATVGPLELYVGLRAEHTQADYAGHAVTVDGSGNVTAIQSVPGSQTYTDLFPSAQVRYSLSSRTDARVAVTRGIARPDYSSLAPSLQGTLGASQSDPSALTAGNPNLKPQHAWNYDALVEHFFPSVGVISGGVFYKQLTDFIFNRTFTYTGPIPSFVGQLGTRPENGGNGHLLGFEGEWVQRLVFLPGAWAGLGFDANFTHVESRALIDPATGRYAPLQRQSPNLANAALTYDYSALSGRLGWAYQGANITSYGDGTASPTGDTYFYAHSQLDGSLIYNFSPRVQIQLQGLNLNNAVFGFFAGTPKHDYAIQREYYGRTIYLGAKYNIGAI
ncbi:MAG: TonB-dependent receptor [Gemmatimonadota bacterium]|nr:TonB-dependent receptor [Gemmatimonadota bacterium]